MKENETPDSKPVRARKAEAPARKRLTPESWIECATVLLVNHGIDGVRVDALAKSLGVSRGGFYWHFKNRHDLLQCVLKAWRDAATEQIIERFEGKNSDPRSLVKELMSLPFRGRSAARAAGVELAIRAWARRDAMARQAVDEVDARRIAYEAQCFSALGFSIAEARARAFLLYAYGLAESLLSNQDSAAKRVERSELVERLLLMPLAEGHL
jgi:AcrR family transcriptional regulator